MHKYTHRQRFATESTEQKKLQAKLKYQNIIDSRSVSHSISWLLAVLSSSLLLPFLLSLNANACDASYFSGAIRSSVVLFCHLSHGSLVNQVICGKHTPTVTNTPLPTQEMYVAKKCTLRLKRWCGTTSTH